MHLLLLLQQDRLYLRLLVRGQAVALGQTRQFFSASYILLPTVSDSGFAAVTGYASGADPTGKTALFSVPACCVALRLFSVRAGVAALCATPAPAIISVRTPIPTPTPVLRIAFMPP